MDNNENDTGCNLDELTERMVKNANKVADSDRKMMLKTIRSDLELLKLNVDQLEILQDIYETLNGNALDDLESQREDMRRSELQLGIFKGLKVGVDKIGKLLKEATTKKTRDTLGNILVNLIAIPAAVTAGVFQVGKELGKVLKDTFTGKGVLGKIFNVFFKFPAMLIAKAVNNFIQSVPILKKASDSIVSFARTTANLFNRFKVITGKLFGNAKDLGEIILGFIQKAFTRSGEGFFQETRRIIAKIGEGISDLYLALLNSARSFGGFAEKVSGNNVVQKFVEKLIQIFKAIQKISVNVGRLFGKLFVPLRVIFSAWAFVTGALEEAGKQSQMFPKVIAGLLGGIGGLFGFIVGGTLDLFKSITGFILGFFGEPGKAVKKFLSGFSFEEVIKDMFGFLTNIVLLFIPGGKSELGKDIMEVSKKLKDSIVDKVTGAFNTFIKDPIVSIFERIGGFFAGVKAFIGSIADQGITGLIKNGIGEVLDNANAEFERARLASMSGSADQKATQTEEVLDNGSIAVKTAAQVKEAVTNVTNNIVNRGGDTVANTQTNIGQSRRQRRGFNNDSGAAHN